MPGRAPADRTAFQQFGGYVLDGSPVILFRKQMLGLGQKPLLESLPAPLARPQDRQALDEALISSGSVPGIVVGVPGFRCDASQRDQNLTLEPVFSRPEGGLAELAGSQKIAIRQYTDAVHRSAQHQSKDG